MNNVNIKAIIAKIKESKSFKEFIENDKELEEMNITGNIVGYDTPNAFSSNEKSHNAKIKDTLDIYGYSTMDKIKKKNTVNNESAYKSVMKSLQEITYNDFKSDKSRPTNKKINDSIREIDFALREIERAVRHASKLKNETNFDQRLLWKSSQSRLVKIHERLVRISKRINELGA